MPALIDNTTILWHSECIFMFHWNPMPCGTKKDYYLFVSCLLYLLQRGKLSRYTPPTKTSQENSLSSCSVSFHRVHHLKHISVGARLQQFNSFLSPWTGKPQVKEWSSQDSSAFSGKKSGAVQVPFFGALCRHNTCKMQSWTFVKGMTWTNASKQVQKEKCCVTCHKSKLKLWRLHQHSA